MIVDLQNLQKYSATREEWDLKVRVSDAKAGRIKGLYFLFDDASSLVYIGKSNDIRQRLNHHLFYDSKYHLSKVYRNEVCFFSFLDSPAVDLFSIERANIMHYKPRMNSPFDRAHYGFSKDDFDSTGDYGRFEGLCTPLYMSL